MVFQLAQLRDLGSRFAGFEALIKANMWPGFERGSLWLSFEPSKGLLRNSRG